MLDAGSVVLDVQGAQNQAHFDRGIPRFVAEQARALVDIAPATIASVALNPHRPLTGNLAWLLGRGLLRFSAADLPPRRPFVYHAMSPVELDRGLEDIWPLWARRDGVATVVTLYDLIPLVFESHYLADPAGRAMYRARLELVRAADQVLAISQTTADDAVERLGVEPERVTVIDAGVSSRFAATYDDDEPAQAVLARELPQVRPGFLLYVSGVEFRKNNERLIAAFGRLPEAVQRAHQLVLGCSMSNEVREIFSRHARDSGVVDGALVMPGYVDDATLAALYRLCRLFVFASFYEGSGLPILEAMACGAPVIAANTSTGPEILGDREGTFDPHDEAEIARCMEETLVDEARLDRLRARSAERVAGYSWEHVATRSLVAYEAALDRASAAARRSRRVRIAWHTPWPPDQSGIADYNRRLLGELARRVDVDVFTTPGVAGQATAPPGVRLFDSDAAGWAADLHQYERHVYCMGNSAFHGAIYEELMRRPGVVVAHDVRLVGFYGWYAGREHPPDPTGRLAVRLADAYGGRVDLSAFTHAAPTPDEQAALGLFLSWEIQAQAEHMLVHSRFAAEVLELDRHGVDGAATPVSVVPFGLPERVPVERRLDAAAPLIASFGVVSVVKGLATLIDAFAVVARERPGARLVLAGPADPAELQRWREHAAQAGVADRVEIPGFVADDDYGRLLDTATLGVQLRTTTNGEASAATGDCIGAGLPTLATDVGWARELPVGVIEPVLPDATPAVLAAQILALLDDPVRYHAMAAAAREHAHAATFGAVADRYLELLGL